MTRLMAGDIWPNRPFKNGSLRGAQHRYLTRSEQIDWLGGLSLWWLGILEFLETAHLMLRP